jgi:hypothetical protein
MAKMKISQQQIDGSVYAYGTVASSVADGVKTLYPVASVGITFNGSNLYTVVTKGIYFIHAQQLQANGASAIYFRIDINGSPVRYAYIPGSIMADANVSEMRELNAGDTIRIYQQNATSSAWEGAHSGYQIYLVKRTD